MKPFDYNKYLKNNPLLKEAKGDETWFSDVNYFKKQHAGYKLKPTDMVSIGDSKVMTYADAVKKFGGETKKPMKEAMPSGKIPTGVSRSTYMKDKYNLDRYLPQEDDIKSVQYTIDLTDSSDVEADKDFIENELSKNGIEIVNSQITQPSKFVDKTRLEIEVPAKQSRQFLATIESNGFEIS